MDTTVLTHNDTVDDGAAKLEATQITFDSLDYAAVPVKVGDVLVITVAGNDAVAGDVNELKAHTVQLATVSTAADPVCTFVTAIPAAQLHSLVDGDGLNVQIVARAQDAQPRVSSLTSKINMYSFALKPEEHQPSGTCNFSRIDTAKLQHSASVTVANIYALNYNVLRVMSGMGGLAYSN